MSDMDTIANGKVGAVNLPGSQGNSVFSVKVGDQVAYAKYHPDKDDTALGTNAGYWYDMAVITRPTLPDAKVFIVWTATEGQDFRIEGVIKTVKTDKPFGIGAPVQLDWWSSFGGSMSQLVSGMDFIVTNGPEFTLDKWSTASAESQAVTYTRLSNLPKQNGTYTVRYRITSGPPYGMICPDGRTRSMNAIPEWLSRDQNLVPVWEWGGFQYTELPGNFWFRKDSSGNWQYIANPPADLGIRSYHVAEPYGTYTVRIRMTYGPPYGMSCPDGVSRQLNAIPKWLEQEKYLAPVYMYQGIHYTQFPGDYWFRMDPNDGAWKVTSGVPEDVPLRLEE